MVEVGKFVGCLKSCGIDFVTGIPGVGGLENGGGRMCGGIGNVRPVKSGKTGQASFDTGANKSTRDGLGQGENGIIFGLDMSGEMHMRRRSEVFGCIPHGRGALT